MNTQDPRTDNGKSGSGLRISKGVPAGFIAIIVIILTAFALRIAYAVKVEPSVDEYITTLAIRQVLETGTPILPSGFVIWVI